MSVPLGRPDGHDAPRPTEHQLAMARVRARTTGESLAHVLSVFMGAGRNGEEPGALSMGTEAPLSGTDAAGEDPVEDPAPLAPVIPLSRASRGKGGSGHAADD